MTPGWSQRQMILIPQHDIHILLHNVIHGIGSAGDEWTSFISVIRKTLMDRDRWSIRKSVIL